MIWQKNLAKELKVFVNEELHENICCEAFNKGFFLNCFVNSLLANAFHTYQVFGFHRYIPEENINIKALSVKIDGELYDNIIKMVDDNDFFLDSFINNLLQSAFYDFQNW